MSASEIHDYASSIRSRSVAGSRFSVDWKDAVVGGRIVVRVATGLAAGETVELAGELLGRGRFDSTPPYLSAIDSDEFAARVRLDDGTVINAPVTSLVPKTLPAPAKAKPGSESLRR